jgi:hypothetical protein
MIGRDSTLTSALDGEVSLNKAIVQLPGHGETLDVAHFRKVAEQSISLPTTLLRHEQVLFVQAQQSAACNASHTVEARLSRWLLRSRDLSGSDTLPLTQEFLAEMLGVQRELRVACGSHPPTSRPNSLQPGPHPDHQPGRPPGHVLRVLWHGESALRPASQQSFMKICIRLEPDISCRVHLSWPKELDPTSTAPPSS